MSHLFRYVLAARPQRANDYLIYSISNIQTPIGYHYPNAPASSVDAERLSSPTCDISTCTSSSPPNEGQKRAHLFNSLIIYHLFAYSIAPAGTPGNDDQAAMATWLIWHLLGLYPGLVSFFFTKTLFPEGSYSILLNPSLLYRVRDTPPKPKVSGTSESLLIVSPMIPKYTSTQLIPEHKHNRDRPRLRRAFRERDGPARRGSVRAERARESLPSATAPPS